MTAPFRTWNNQEPFEIFPGVNLNAIGGEQVVMCKVTYAPGSVVPEHDHPEAEQLMYVVEGEITVDIDGEVSTLRTGDVAVINRGVAHSLVSEGGCTFIEAMSPVPRDHVPDPERDLVLGPQGDSLHVER